MNESPVAPTSASIRYSVVIPFYDEAGNAGALIREIGEALRDHADYEIIAVDDASIDGTVAELRQALAASSQPGSVLVHARNRGQSAALCTGIDAASGDWIVTLDGDGQNDPADIPTLIRHLQNSAPPPALICGHRWRRQDDTLRRLSSLLANGIRARLLGDETPDTGCGLKLMDRRVVLQLPRFDHMHRFLPALFRRAGAHVISLPVNHRPRLRGRSKYGVWNRLWVGIVDLIGVMWLNRRAFRPSAIEEHRHGR